MNICIKNKNKGFTLIELLVVVAIISLLSSVIFSSLKDARAKSRDAKRMLDMKAMQTAIELAKTSGIQLPSAYAPIGSALTSRLVPIYIAAIPSDPNPGVLISTPYYYCNNVLQTSGNYCHNDTDINTYAIAFFTEKKMGSCPGNTGSWQTSLCCLTSEGIFPGETGNVAGFHCRER